MASYIFSFVRFSVNDLNRENVEIFQRGRNLITIHSSISVHYAISLTYQLLGLKKYFMKFSFYFNFSLHKESGGFTPPKSPVIDSVQR